MTDRVALPPPGPPEAPPPAPWRRVPIESIRRNPFNPRIVRDERFRALVASIQKNPGMLELRPVVVNGEGMILGGNARHAAARAAGMTDIPVIEALGLTKEQERDFILKDNVSAGEWDLGALNAGDWDLPSLADFGVDIAFLPDLAPRSSRRQVTDADVAEAAEDLGGAFTEARVKRDVTCPHCGKDFGLDA